MKTYHFIFVSLLISMGLFSCMAGEIDDMHSASPEGNRTVTISGEKMFKLDPIMVGILVKTEKGEIDYAFEFMGPNLTEEFVKIDWRSNDFCDITFTENNGGKKIQHIDMSDNKIHIQQEVVLSPDTEDLIHALPQ